MNLWRTRKRLAVDLDLGQHLLFKRYPDDVFYNVLIHRFRDTQPERDLLWRLDPPPASREPGWTEVAAAIAGVKGLQQSVNHATRSFHDDVKRWMEENDSRNRAEDLARVDDALPDDLRLLLFVLRGRAAGDLNVLQALNRLQALTG